MRKLIYGINVSLDGCCDHTRFGGGADVHEYFRRLLEDSDLLLYGRKTYQLMVPFWPDVARDQSLDDVANAFATTFSRLKRVVVSRTLTELDDPDATLLRGNIREEILKLKQQPGGPISTGGVDFPSRLLEWQLIDEFHIVVHPVIVGEGRRLFSESHLLQNAGLKLVGIQHFESGCVALRYESV